MIHQFGRSGLLDVRQSDALISDIFLMSDARIPPAFTVSSLVLISGVVGR